MLDKIASWLKHRFSKAAETSRERDKPISLHRTQRVARPAPKKPQVESVKFKQTVPGTIEEVGPGKNVLIRNKYIREDTGTHETLKILDDSMIDTGEESGIDPYNTGGFDRSKNWNNRFRD